MTPEQFWSRVDKSGECWLWTGALNYGYGQAWIEGRVWRVHRFAYTQLVGPIPDGLEIDHVRARGCTSRACVNPAHLEAVTGRENNMRSNSISARRAARETCDRGHPFTGIKRGYRYCKVCHAESGRRLRDTAKASRTDWVRGPYDRPRRPLVAL